MAGEHLVFRTSLVAKKSLQHVRTLLLLEQASSAKSPEPPAPWMKCTTDEEEETEFEEDRKRGSSGTIRQTYPGHVVRVKMRRETTGPPAKGRQEHLV